MAKDYPTLKLFIVLCLVLMAFYVGLKCNRGALEYPEPFTPPLPSPVDIQRRVGAKPDGIVGPETISKWETAYANQEAAKFMTPSGAPKGEAK